MIVTTTVGRPTMVPERAAVVAVAFSGVRPGTTLVLSSPGLWAQRSSALVVLASPALDAAAAVFAGTAAVVVTADDPALL